MKKLLAAFATLLTFAVAAPVAHAQYNAVAGQSAPASTVERVPVKDRSGAVHYEEHRVAVKADRWGINSHVVPALTVHRLRSAA